MLIKRVFAILIVFCLLTCGCGHQNHNKEVDDNRIASSQQQSTEKEAMVWIPTNGGVKYHSDSFCSNMKNPKSVPLSKAQSLGFTACKKCY